MKNWSILTLLTSSHSLLLWPASFPSMLSLWMRPTNTSCCAHRMGQRYWSMVERWRREGRWSFTTTTGLLGRGRAQSQSYTSHKSMTVSVLAQLAEIPLNYLVKALLLQLVLLTDSCTYIRWMAYEVHTYVRMYVFTGRPVSTLQHVKQILSLCATRCPRPTHDDFLACTHCIHVSFHSPPRLPPPVPPPTSPGPQHFPPGYSLGPVTCTSSTTPRS